MIMNMKSSFLLLKKALHCLKLKVLVSSLPPSPQNPSSISQHLYLSLTQKTVLSSESPKLPEVQRWPHTTQTVCLLFICLRERPDLHPLTYGGCKYRVVHQIIGEHSLFTFTLLQSIDFYWFHLFAKWIWKLQCKDSAKQTILCFATCWFFPIK